jgi:hypothetical protein
MADSMAAIPLPGVRISAVEKLEWQPAPFQSPSAKGLGWNDGWKQVAWGVSRSAARARASHIEPNSQ